MNLKQYILKQVSQRKLTPAEAGELLVELKHSRPAMQKVAIIGMACRFPLADSTAQFWDNIVELRNCVTPYPPRRQSDSNAFRAASLVSAAEDKYKRGGYLQQIDQFDPQFFRISPSEALLMDPYQRLLLEVAYHALEDSGYGGGRIRGTQTGVYIGRDHTNCVSEYREIIDKDNTLALTGSYTGILAGRISYTFGLKGPSVVIDTACSSGLACLHQAGSALLSGECDLAIVGGITIDYIPLKKSLYELVESPDETLRTFDRNANGTVWGEGVGVVILKRYTEACRDKDNIQAVIIGSGMNNDGIANGITAPNPEAQFELLCNTWEKNSIEPETISYLETHGTGTSVGDEIEIKSVSRAFRQYTNRKQFCAISSLKPMLGHLVAASGMAAMIKVVLCLKHGILPGLLHFREANYQLQLENSPLFINDITRAWQNTAPLRAAINSFGFSGTNVHVVLEEAPAVEADPGDSAARELFTLSARTESSLTTMLERYNTFLQSRPRLSLRDLCFTANTGRGHYAYRLAIPAGSLAELGRQIQSLVEQGPDSADGESAFFGKIRADKPHPEPAGGQDPGGMPVVNPVEPNPAAEALCQLYVRGGEIDWQQLYAGRQGRRVSLPRYVYTHRRYWPEVDHVSAPAAGQRIHPLIDEFSLENECETIYSTCFSVAEHWVLKEHVLHDNSLIPGTAYLEIAFQLGKNHLQQEKLALTAVVFERPFVLAGGEKQAVNFVLKRSRAELSFRIVSKNTRGHYPEEWLTHAQGKIEVISGPPDPALNVESLRERLPESAEFLAPASDFTFGERWNCIKAVYGKDDEYLVDIGLPEKYHSDLGEYALHPALLDTAVNALSQDIYTGTYLPFSYGELRIYRRLPGRFYSYLRLNRAKSDPETIVFDITIFSRGNEVLCTITNYSLKRLHRADAWERNPAGPSLHRIGLVKYAPVSAQRYFNDNSVLIFSACRNQVDELCAALDNPGSYYSIAFGEQFKKTAARRYIIPNTRAGFDDLLGRLDKEQIRQIFYLSGTRGRGGLPEAADFQADYKAGILGVFYLLKALLKHGCKKELEFFFVSESFYPQAQGEPWIGPYPSALHAFTRVLKAEYPLFTIRCFDLDQTAGAAEWKQIVRNTDRLHAYACRTSAWYTPQLTGLAHPEVSADPVTLAESGTYIITGGTGALGLEVARHLSALKGGLSLVLLARSQFPPRGSWEEILRQKSTPGMVLKIKQLLAMEQSGAGLEIYSIDITDYAAMQSLFASLREKHSRINGIIHCAGVAGRGFLINKEEKVLTEVFLPKSLGLLVLDKLSGDISPDFFITFSSITALKCDPGQGDYAAGNAFMNGFMESRSQVKAGRSLSILWPAWQETGMAVDFGVNTAENIVNPIMTGEALAALGRAFQSGYAAVIAGQLNYSQLADFSKQNPLLFTQQMEQNIKISGSAVSRAGSKTRKEAVSLQGAETYTGAEKQVAEIWYEVLGISEFSLDDNFYNLGGDSILAVNLSAKLNEQYDLDLDVSDIFNYLTLRDLAVYIEQRQTLVRGDTGPGTQTVSPNPVPAGHPVFREVDNLSWRQLNCFDKALCILLGLQSTASAGDFKLLIGFQRGFDCGAMELGFDFREETRAYGYPDNEKLLAAFKLQLMDLSVSGAGDLRQKLAELLRQQKKVIAVFDEYYYRESPYYQKTHTDHRIIITGQQAEGYRIINYDPRTTDRNGIVTYGEFDLDFKTLDAVYAAVSDQQRVLLYLEPDQDSPGPAATGKLCAGLLAYIKQSRQAGRDLVLLREIFSAGDSLYFREENLKEIYTRMGAKELFFNSVPASGHRDETGVETLLQENYKLIKDYAMSIFRKKVLKQELYLEQIDRLGESFRNTIAGLQLVREVNIYDE